MENREKNNIQYAQITDVGCVRELNEDSLFCGDDLWLVADGMGGHACGEVASQLAAETISSEFAGSGNLVKAIEVAHQSIVSAAENGIGQHGMGTTVVALSGDERHYQLAWVGDSRAYLWDQKRAKLAQLSEDHSLMVRLINSGLITPEDAKKHPQRHMITQCLGSVEIERLSVSETQDEWKANQQILLCSDGLSDEVNEEILANILSLNLGNHDKLVKLVEAAKYAGGRDNISIVLIDSPVSETPSFWERFKSMFSR